MTNKVMDGLTVANSIYSEIKSQYVKLYKQTKTKPKLVIVLVGNDESSLIYVNQKINACKMLGFECVLSHLHNLSGVNSEDIKNTIYKYNQDKSVHGIIVQMPLPTGFRHEEILMSIAPKKDVDGLHPINYGLLSLGKTFENIIPCTALGVLKLLEYYKVDFTGKNVVIVGSGIVAGKAVSLALSNRKSTVTICNSKTKNLKNYTLKADILISATGKSKLIKDNMVKKGVIVIDIGISRLKNGKLSGDVDFDKVIKKAKLISPVPGGVGKLTVASLMFNLLEAYKKSFN